MRIPLPFWGDQSLSAEAKQALCLLAAGGTLKAHRSLDGEKAIWLLPLNGSAIEVSDATMDQLKRRRLLHSNMKFPAATYLLTDKGRRAASLLTGQETNSSSQARRFSG